jgi:uncharacterized membrane protein YbaN (DUF454 family)
LRRIGGTAVFILGIVALVLPVLPGWLLIGVGLFILSKDSPGMQDRIMALRRRYASVDKVMREVERRFGPREKTDVPEIVISEREI